MKKRLFAAFVSLCLIVSMLPTMAFAEAGVQYSGIVTGASGLCERHTEHTATPSDAQPEEYTCKTLCTEEEINGDCPVCSAEGAELDMVFVGVAPVSVRSGSAHTHPVCGSSGSCTDPDHGTEHTDVTWTEWNGTTSLPDSGGNYYLTGNVTLSETWEAPSEETSLCLNGYSITYENSSDQGSVIRVPSGVTLTITDCADTPGKITGGTGTETRYNTSILSGGHFGGGIYVKGILNLYNGSIEGNHIPSTDGMRYDGGGGVFVNGKEAHFNMYGGIIQDNAAYTAGAGVLCYKSQFNMYGGEITGHKNPGYDGAVCLDEGSTMTMTGGTVAGNTDYREQIYISKDAKLIVDGSSAVIAEESEEYAIHAFNGGKVEIRNGSIGSEVVILQQSELIVSGGQILKIRVSRGSNMAVSGGKVSKGISLGSDDSEYWGWGTIMLSEAPEISGITLMNPKNVITVTGQLTYLSPIPVTKSGGVLTSSWSAYMDGAAAENYFNCGDYELQQLNGEIHLVEPGAHEHGGILFDKDMQSFTEDQYGYYVIDADSNYYLSNNYTIGDTASFDPTLFIGDGTNEVTVNLCLNGYELTRADSPYVDGSIIVVRENATLNLYDCKSTGTITGGTGRTGEKNGNTYSYGGGILVYGTLNMYGGTITGNSANADGVAEGFGGGVYVADGSAFTMYGGSIINNSAKTTGGGVAVAGDGESVPMSEAFGFNETITNWKNGANGGGKMTIGNDTDIIVQDNMAGTAASNIYFPSSAPNMTVSSLPAQGTQIGIRMETPGQFAAMGTGVDEAQAQTFFTSDDTTYNVLVIEDGLALGKQQNEPTIGINYQTEMLTGFVNAGSYTMNGKAVTPSADGTIAIQEEWMGTTLSIVRKGDGDTADSNAQNLLIPARPVAPDVTAGIQKINGADASMEYSSDSGATWTAFTDETIPRISAGTYLVRYCVKADAFASQSTSEIYVRNSSGGGSSGGSGGGGSSSDNDSTVIERPDKDDPTTPTTAETKTVKADSKGNVVITRSMVADAISIAQADARKNGNTANDIAVVVPMEIDKTLDSVQITLKADALDKLVSSSVKRFTIDANRMADCGFTLDTLKELNRQTSGDVILKIKTTAVSSQEAKAAIGSRPAYDITLWYVKDGKETQITSLNGKTVSIAFPYTPAQNEQTGNLYAVSVDGSGKVQWLTKSSYNADQKAVIFEAQHFSVYGVGYQNSVPNFTDINGHWAKEHILFTVSRGLFSGTSENTFSPDSPLTRGMFVTAFGRLAGINPEDYQNRAFTDVKADAYYAPYVNWAAKTGIVDGITSTTFAPDSNITREQMAVILKNYADKMGYPILKTLEAVTLADNAKISSWAKDAVKAMQQAGILSGKANNLFDPNGNATRAEAATVLHRFVEAIIDPQTANGWTQNDSGEWSYYKDGELVKGWRSDDQKWYWLDKTTGKMFSGGWKQIDGKWYYFYADGSMAANTKVDGYEVGADGARK